MADTNAQTSNDVMLKVAERTSDIEEAMGQVTEELAVDLKAAGDECKRNLSNVQVGTVPTL